MCLSSTPYTRGGTDVKSRLNRIRIHELVMTLPENPEMNWYQNNKFTYIWAMKTNENRSKWSMVWFFSNC